MLEQFKEHNFQQNSLDRIAQANAIIAEYEGYRLTLNLRQLYYQFVSRAYLDNIERSYKALGNLISKGREAGLISWQAIEDRGRTALRVSGESDPRSVLYGLERKIIIDPWLDQEIYPEVWIEKDALTGTIESVCKEYRATYLACKGYLSASESWRGGQRFRQACEAGKRPVIIHLGDHDPSGLDMTRDNQTRCSLFSGHDVEIRRIALNMDQIESYRPPPNPAKETDTRAHEYRRLYGDSSWELDALEPRVISDLVRKELQSCITDQAAWDAVKDREDEAKTHLKELYWKWPEVVDLLEGGAE